jgi:multicomponent Na+:H+ antiporter subunit D
MIEPLVLLLVLPFGGAVVCLLLRGRAALAGAWLAAVATVAAASALAVQVAQQGVQRHALGGWGAPLGIELRADGLSVLLVVVTAAVAVACTIYARSYFTGGGRGAEVSGWSERDAFWPLWLFLWGALNALFVSADLFNIYVTLELVTLAGIALLVLHRGSDALAAGIRYLLAAFLGSLAYLFGVGLLYGEFHSLDIVTLRLSVTPTVPATVALALMTAGLALKTALFPLHFWLPRAHAAAPAPVSAALSALVVKGSFYVLLRLWFDVFAGDVPLAAAQVVGGLGAVAVVWGSVQAIRARQLKMMIAHSTVAQVGYLFLLLPLVATAAAAGPAGAQAAADAWNGGIYQVLAHALAKAAMFLVSGALIAGVATDRLESVTGLAARLPVAFFAFGLAGVSLIGLPPMGGFVAKLLLLNSAVASGQWWYTVVIVGGGVLTAGYVFLVLGKAFSDAGTDPPADSPVELRPVPRSLQLVPLALALLALAVGLGAAAPLDLLAVGSPFPPIAPEVVE